MNDENVKRIIAEYPALYKDYGGDPMKTCMAWGFACGDGWAEILLQLTKQLKWIADKSGAEFTAFQVKEKYGTLRFYFDTASDDEIASILADAAVCYAENRTANTCEMCGERGTLNKAGWITCLCEKCKNQPR